MKKAARYKPGAGDPPFNPTYCGAAVSSYSGGFSQCFNLPVVQGKWCRRHAPGANEHRRLESDRKRHEEDEQLLARKVQIAFATVAANLRERGNTKVADLVDASKP